MTRSAASEVVEKERDASGKREKKRGFRAHMKCTGRRWGKASVTVLFSGRREPDVARAGFY